MSARKRNTSSAQARRLSKEGLRLLELMNEAEASVYRNVNLANYRAWYFGKFLVRAKSELGHGLFSLWRAATFANVHERKAQRCQELFIKNPKATELSDLSDQALKKWISRLSVDSIRKFRLGYLPAKDQPEHEGNERFPRLVSFVNIANEFNRLSYRHRNDLQKIDFAAARKETFELYEFLRWLHGDSDVNPLDPKE